MEVQILAKKENPLLQRTEGSFKAIHKAEPTPTRDAIRQELAKHLKAAKDVVVVDGARSTFGRSETSGYAKVYKSKEQALSVERYHILVRNKLAEPKAKEAKPGEAGPAPQAGRAPPGGRARAAEAEPPAPPAKKEEAKPEPRPEPKAEAKAEAKHEAKPHRKEEKKPAEKKAEPKAEHKAEHKAEGKKEEKPEAKKVEPRKKGGK